MDKAAPFFVAGHRGLIGSAIERRLKQEGHVRVLTRERKALDLTDSVSVDRFFAEEKPRYVALCAARVGGILENRDHPADMITENLAISLNTIRAAQRNGVERFLYIGSSCMYPRECPQPMAETQLLTGIPEPTSLPYAMAKLAGMHLCLAYNEQYGGNRFLTIIANNAYGPNDDFDLGSSHVLSALIRRFHEAKRDGLAEVALWGSGRPRREFVHADDIASASYFLLNGDATEVEWPLNVGTGEDHSIRELADIIASVVGYTGRVVFDPSKPDGAPRKLLDSRRLRALGWAPKIELKEGIRRTYEWYLSQIEGKE